MKFLVTILLAAIMSAPVSSEPGFENWYAIPVVILEQDTEATYWLAPDGNIFASDRQEWHMPGRDYVLVMDSCGTSEVEDNVILAVYEQ